MCLRPNSLGEATLSRSKNCALGSLLERNSCSAFCGELGMNQVASSSLTLEKGETVSTRNSCGEMRRGDWLRTEWVDMLAALNILGIF